MSAFRRLLLAVAAAFLFAPVPSALASHSPNNVPLDLEHVLRPNYWAGLSVFNLYWDSTWDADHPGATMATIDAATSALLGSGYGARLTQYDVPGTLGFAGSAGPIGLCGGSPGTLTNTPALLLFMACEEATPFSGVPFAIAPPLATTTIVYNVILPVGSNIADVITNPFDGTVIFANGSCNAGITPAGGGSTYGAYHALVPSIPFPPPGDLIPRGTIFFTIIPADCAKDASGALSVPQLMALLSHEIVETVTDPVPLGYWYDLSTAIAPGGGGLFSALTAGEAADICQGSFGAVPIAPAGIPMTVNAYWSNSDDACVVGTSRVVSMSFSATGLPAALRTITLGGVTRSLPLNEPELEGTSYAFPATVTDPAQPGVRWVRSGCLGGAPTGSVTFPAGNTTANASDSISCAYTREVFVTIATSPAAAATGNASLTASQWVTANTALAVDADLRVPAGTGSRYDFRDWSDGSVTHASTPASFFVSAPVTITARYALQHRIDFDATGIPAATAWHVTVGSATTTGPAFGWFDDGSSLSFAYETPVADSAAPTTRYVLSGTSTPSPLTVSAPLTVVGTYGTQYLLSVTTSGLGANTTAVANGGTPMGAASDAAAAARWFPAGTAIALQVDDPVHGAGGVEYFFDAFAPAPPASLTAGFATVARYLTMAQQIADALAGGGITGSGLASSYSQQWAAVEAALAAPGYAQALDAIESFVAHLEAQTGKKVTPATSSQLRLDAAAVYHHALCAGVAAGQIGAAGHATRYAWYAALVTSLGGTPLPDC